MNSPLRTQGLCKTNAGPEDMHNPRHLRSGLSNQSEPDPTPLATRKGFRVRVAATINRVQFFMDRDGVGGKAPLLVAEARCRYALWLDWQRDSRALVCRQHDAARIVAACCGDDVKALQSGCHGPLQPPVSDVTRGVVAMHRRWLPVPFLQAFLQPSCLLGGTQWLARGENQKWPTCGPKGCKSPTILGGPQWLAQGENRNP